MKRKLLFAMLCIVSVLGMRAQLTNGTVYWIQDASTGQFISQGNNWGTQATVKDVGGIGLQAVYVSDGVYKLKNITWNTVNSADLGLRTSDRFLDQAAGDCTLEASGVGYKINTSGGYLCNNQSANANGVKPLGSTNNAAEATVWKFLTKAQYDAAIQAYKDGKAASFATSMGETASTVAALEAIITDVDKYRAVDVTSSISNPTLGSSWDGWTHGAAVNSNRGEGAGVGSGCAEFWNGCGYATQTVSGLANGLYRLDFAGTFRPKGAAQANNLASENTSSPAFVSANSASVEFVHWIDVSNKADGRAGIVKPAYNNTLYTYVSDGTLTIRVVQDAWFNGNMWCPFGQFTLTYYTDQVADADITTLVGTIPASNIPTAVASNLSSLQSTLESEKTIAAYNALAAAITAANSLSPTYVLFTTIKGNVLALKTQTSKFSARTGSSAFNNLDSDVNDAQDVADAATTIAGIEAAIDDLRTAAFTFANAAGINTNDYIDMTDAIIINPTVSVNVDGWTVADKVGGTGPTTNYGETEFYNATFDFYQNLTLPRGTYEFGVTGFHRAGDHSTYFYAGSDDHILIPGVGSDVVNTMAAAKTYFDNGNGQVSLKFALENASQTIKIGIENTDTQTDKWTIFRNFTLYYYGSAIDYSVYTSRWSELTSDAATAKTTYASVTGSELTALNTALADAPDGSSKANYIAKISALEAALTAFNTAGPHYDAYVAAKTAADNEKTKADLISTSIYTGLYGSDPIPSSYPTSSSDADTKATTLTGITQALKVAEYNYVNTNYTTPIDLGAWTTVNAGDKYSQHWDGTNSTTYNEQNEGWGTAAVWTTSYTQDIELPTGQYVFKVAGRHSQHSTLTLTVTDVTGGGSVQLGTISDFPVGDTGLGINTSGATDFTTGEGHTYANGGTGRGWEWRYVPFLLDNGDDMATIRISVVGGNPDAYQYQWVSFCNYTVQSAPSVAASTVRYNQALAAATAARDNATYANVGGTDRSNLLAAIADTPDPASIAELDAAADALITATETFTAGVASWNTYALAKTAADNEKTKADNINASIHSAAIPSATTAAEAASMTSTLNTLVQTIKGEIYTYVQTNYTLTLADMGAVIGDWTITGTDTGAENTGQHWDGNSASKYLEQSGGATGWGSATGWNIDFSRDITLPAGNYVFKVAGRHSAAVTMTATVKKKSDSSVLGTTINDFPATAAGHGINTSGATDFATGEGHTYAGDGGGYGWEWRYIAFTLASETTVSVSVNGSTAATHQWMGFCNGEMLTSTIPAAQASGILASADEVDGGIMEGTVQTALTSAKTTFSSDQTNAIKYGALRTAIANAQASIDAYVSAKAYIDRMEEGLEISNFYTTAAYNQYYKDIKDNYDARTLPTNIAATLNAEVAYQAGNTYQEANYLDDILLSAWTIGGEECADFTKGLVINTWSTEGDNDGSGFVKPFYEYYGADAESLAATTIVGTKTGLTASTDYAVGLRARVRQTNGQTKVANSINLTVGSGESIDLTSGDQVGASQFYVDDLMAVGSTDGSGNLTVTINVAADSHVSWLSFRDVKYYSASDLVTELNALKTTATTLLGSGDYENITCYERTHLTTLKNKANPASVSDLVTDINNLKAAIAAFQAGQADYVLLATEKTKAENLNVETATINTCLTEPAADAIKALKVAEYNYVVTNYNTTITLGEWTAVNAANMNSQHWDGTNGTQYQEQAAVYWGSTTAWTTSYTQDIELPTGQYVFKVAGRHSQYSTLTLSVTDVTDGENPVELGSISDFPVGDHGRGIDTSGATNFSDSGTYSVFGNPNSSAVGGGGTGWEWRYVPFLLDNGEDMATIRISVVGANPDAHQYQWVGFCNYTVQSAPSLPASTLHYEQALAAAEAARDNATYTNVQGKDRADLLTAIAATPDMSSISSLDDAAQALEDATTAFTSGVDSWNNYVANRALTVAEKTRADAFSTSIYTTLYGSDPIPSYTASTTAADAATLVTTFDTMTKALKVGEYNYVTTDYSYAVDLGTWSHSDNVGIMNSQHWDGTSTSTYMEQGAGNLAYNLPNWEVNYYQNLLLPAGNYIFKVAGRTASTNVTVTLNVTDVTDPLNPSVLGTVNDFPKGDVGLGINTSGATDFTTGEGHTYANAGNGRGWEWRYVKFTLAEPATVKVSVDAVATAQYRWMGFCNPTVHTDDEDNATLVRNLVALNDAKLAATLTKIDYNIGTGIFQYNETTNNSLWSAYSTAKTNADAFTLTGETTPSSVSTLTTALTTAQANYENQALNQPNAEKRYWLTIHEDGKAWNGNAITFIEGGRNDQGLYGIKYLTPANANLTQAIKLTPTGTNNNFKVSVLRPDGEEQYLTTGSTYGGEDIQIRTTDDEDEASWVKIVPTETDNEFYIYNVTTGTKIANNNNNDVYTAGSANFTIAEASKLTVTASAKAGKNGTVIFPFKPDVSDAAFDNIKFYTCDDVSESGYVQMTEVAEPEAKTPYLIRNDGGSDVSVNLSDYSTLTEDDYDDGNVEGLLTGVYQVSTIPHSEENGEIRYALQTKKSTGIQAFYRVSYTTDLEGLPAYKAYLTLPAAAGVKEVFFLDFSGMETDINSVETSEEDRDAVIYNLAGQRVSKTTKGGVYIVNGKKVLVK